MPLAVLLAQGHYTPVTTQSRVKIGAGRWLSRPIRNGSNSQAVPPPEHAVRTSATPPTLLADHDGRTRCPGRAPDGPRHPATPGSRTSLPALARSGP